MTVCRICIIRDGMMILGGGAGSPKISTIRMARSVVSLLLSLNTTVAVPIHFHTIVSDVHARLDAYICHNCSAAHGMETEGDALVQTKSGRIR